MRKYLTVIMGALLLAALAACGESSVEPVDNEADAAEETSGGNDTENNNSSVEEADGSNGEPADEENNSGENGTETDGNAGNDEANEVIEEDLGIGDTINFDGVHITLNGVRTSEGAEFFEPDNDFFLILDLTAENTTDEAASISTMLQMSLLDPDGYSQDLDVFADTKGSMDGEVGPGRKMAGEVSFDAEDSDYFEFIFENPFSTGQAIWKIDRSDWE